VTAKGRLDRAALVAALGKLGLRPTSHIMAHASLSALGVVDGGAATVVDALREAAGPEGAVVMPSFRGAIREPDYGMRACVAVCPQALCPSRERGSTGIVGETVREQPDSLRSCHPTHSWVGIGGGARYLLEGHFRSLTCCGEDSPFFRLMERDGVLLLLGLRARNLTYMHAAEDALNLPYLSAIDPGRRHTTYTTSGRRIQYRYPDLLHAALDEARLLRGGPTGSSTSYVLSAREFGAFLWVVTEDDPWCWTVRPDREGYDPFTDACRKTARMVAVWRERRDPEAWRLLAARSREPRRPAYFRPAAEPATGCPAYRGVVRGYPRCAANDLPPWEKFGEYPRDEPGVATCEDCNWPRAPHAQEVLRV
jgi:aminoglycoside 3-N-acetyltransferase